jgi:hypothetical protein
MPMYFRSTLLSFLFGVAAALLLMIPAFAQSDTAGSSVPLSNAWNIASSGKASSSGELLFRVTPGNGQDPVEVTVFVLSGANETGVASSIRRALSTQLDPQRFDIESGQGANVLVTTGSAGAAGQSTAGFSVELVTSDVENVRVMVQSAAPVAPPTVPAQSVPADPAAPASPANPTPSSPGDAVPPNQPANPQTPTPQSPAAPSPNAPASPSPAAPPPDSPTSPSPTTPPPASPPASSPAAPPPGGATPSSANGGAGAPASAPPPPPATPGGM